MFEAKWLTGNDDLTQVYSIRFAVFVDEQGVPPELEKDEYDRQAYHVLVSEGSKDIATGRLFIENGEFYIGRIAVLKEYRGKKYGDLVMRMLIYKAFETGAEVIRLHSQLAAKGFYERLGFQSYGEVFDEAGISHISMKLEKGSVPNPPCCL